MNVTNVDAGVTMASAPATMAAAAGAGYGYSQYFAGDQMNAGVYEEGYYGDGAWGMSNQRSGFQTQMEHMEGEMGGGFYEGMALPDHLLEQYYSQVRGHVNNLNHNSL